MSTHSKPTQRNTTKNSTRLMIPVIGLERPEDSANAGKFDGKIKCRTNPTDASSTTYKIGMAYFKDGTPEEWLLYKNRMKRCLDCQGATAGPSKFSLARRLLMGRTLADFNNSASLRTTETRENYLQCINAVTLALQEQKIWMRCFLKKPADWDIKRYVARMVEINKYLPQFPPKVIGKNSEKLPDNELLELLEFGIPLK